jgi:hypothetical protein
VVYSLDHPASDRLTRSLIRFIANSMEDEMGQFDDVDLGGDKAMARMIKAEQDKRNAIIEECAKVAERDGHWQVASKIRLLKALS